MNNLVGDGFGLHKLPREDYVEAPRHVSRPDDAELLELAHACQHQFDAGGALEEGRAAVASCLRDHGFANAFARKSFISAHDLASASAL